MKGTVICASKKQRKLWMVHNGRILITLDARFGRASEPTAEGVHIIYWKDKNHVSSVYGSPMPYSMFFYRGQAFITLRTSPVVAGMGPPMAASTSAICLV